MEPASPEETIEYLRANEIALTYDQATGTLRAGATGVTKTITGKQAKPGLKGPYRKEEKERTPVAPALAEARARVTIRRARNRAAVGF